MSDIPLYTGESTAVDRRLWIAVCAVVVAVLLATGFSLGRLTQNQSQPCLREAPNLSAIRQLRGLARYDAAGSMAESDLSQFGGQLCLEARTALVQETYDSGIDGLFVSTHQEGDIGGGHEAVIRWQKVEAFADRYQLPSEKRRPLLSIFQQAYDHNYFELAREAWLAAWRKSPALVQDPRLLGKYYAAIRNLGYEMAAKGPESERERGKQMLRTAAQIAVGRLGGEAYEDLKKLVGTDESKWPQPLSDPVLDFLVNNLR